MIIKKGEYTFLFIKGKRFKSRTRYEKKLNDVHEFIKLMFAPPFILFKEQDATRKKIQMSKQDERLDKKQ